MHNQVHQLQKTQIECQSIIISHMQLPMIF